MMIRGSQAVAAAYDELVQNFVNWAQSREDLRCAVILGSRARSNRPADEWSDLDFCLFVHDMQPYLENAAWLEQIGRPLLTFLERTGDGNSWERRVLFEGGLDVDFALIPLDMVEAMRKGGLPPEDQEVFRRGFGVLFDKDGWIAELLPKPGGAPRFPAVTEGNFLQVVNDFWYHALWTAKHLRRGELWWAKGCCDGYLKGLLRTMLEWHARSTGAPGTDTWMRGRFLEQWADQRAVQALANAYAHYDAEDVWLALLNTMQLFRWLSLEVVEKWGFDYPSAGADAAAAMVQELFETR